MDVVIIVSRSARFEEDYKIKIENIRKWKGRIIMKKLIAMLLTGAMVFSMSACGSESKTEMSSDVQASSETKQKESSVVVEESEEIVTLKMYLLGNPVAKSDFAPVLEAMNEITREEIGAELDITFIDGGSMSEKMNVIMGSGEVFDICWTGYANNYANAVSNGALYDLTDLINGSEVIKEAVPEDLFEYVFVDDKLYAVPCMQSMSVPRGIHLRKDLVEKYNFDYESCETLADFEPFFAAVAENEPEMVAYNTNDSKNCWSYKNIYAELDLDYGLVVKKDGSNKIYSIFDIPEYKDDAELIRSFFEKGYLAKDALTYDRANIDADIKAGKTAAWERGVLPGVEAEDFNKFGFETVVKRIEAPTLNSPVSTMMSVSVTSENPEKAFEMIELLNCNTDLMDLLCYGVEGTHYTKNDAGKIVLKENKVNPFVKTLLKKN